MWMTRRAIIAACVAAVGATSPAVGGVPLTIGFSTRDVSNLLVYIAKDEGFFEKEGLDVQFVQFQNDNAAAQALVAGAVQVNCASIFPVLDSHAAGRDLVAIWGLSNLPGYNWYSQPKFKSISDLKGKGKVGVSAIGAMSYQLSVWAINKAGLDAKKDVSFLALGGPIERVAALKVGQVDLIPATPPGTFLLEKDGFKPLLELRNLEPEFTYETFYTRRSTLKRDEEAFRLMLTAIIKAKLWAVNNIPEATKILMANMGAPADQEDVYRKTVEFALPYSPISGEFPVRSIDVLLGFYKENGKIKAIPEHTAFIDPIFINYFKSHPVQ